MAAEKKNCIANFLYFRSEATPMSILSVRTSKTFCFWNFKLKLKQTSPPIGALKCNFPPFIRNYDKKTEQHQSDMRVHREATVPKEMFT